MTRETMKHRRETADPVRKIEAYKMATRKPCETALKQKGHKAFACEFKGGERANKDAVEYIAEKYNIKERIPGGD
ncbi:hypothetical protein [Mediterraneibacter gnavus]|jgi:hypothetical protein|uniref:hypothetical protein n=1 Tax=Mediterraneibacter gnavus TaxID=33038 RepID=UPI0020634933|nr:hypothetical protein [Mediterraneibacter gnavus]MDB8683573.1 hypothetical protein [Mediterraneibacter gnavus]MDB8694033.1 hypothetical protein [Mediterraneibacter gnavus]MDB8701027.1 hypothetical protein [Mediterraneibacter gnavus]DAY89863.1 MAG TPA: hypothetical protein [Caudoviricetes sp.]